MQLNLDQQVLLVFLPPKLELATYVPVHRLSVSLDSTDDRRLLDRLNLCLSDTRAIFVLNLVALYCASRFYQSFGAFSYIQHVYSIPSVDLFLLRVLFWCAVT